MAKDYGTEPIFRIAPTAEFPHEREAGRRRPHAHAHTQAYAQAAEAPVHRDAEDVASVLGLPADHVSPEVVEALSNVLGEIDRLHFLNTQSEYRLRHLERLADHHTIVPALNRRGFVRELDSFLAGGEAEGVLVIFHVAGIEVMGGVHGLVASEGALRHVCAAIIQELRASDLIACIGGSDFAVLMPACTKEDAAAKIASIVHHVNEPGFTWMGRRETLTVQWGMHDLSVGEGAEQAVAAADRSRRGLEG